MFTSVVFTGPNQYETPKGYEGSDAFPLHTTWKLWFVPDQTVEGHSYRLTWPPMTNESDSMATNRSCFRERGVNEPWVLVRK